MSGEMFSQMAKLAVTPSFTVDFSGAFRGGLFPQTVNEPPSTKTEDFKFFADRVNPRDVTNVEDSSGHRRVGH